AHCVCGIAAGAAWVSSTNHSPSSKASTRAGTGAVSGRAAITSASALFSAREAGLSRSRTALRNKAEPEAPRRISALLGEKPPSQARVRATGSPKSASSRQRSAGRKSSQVRRRGMSEILPRSRPGAGRERGPRAPPSRSSRLRSAQTLAASDLQNACGGPSEESLGHVEGAQVLLEVDVQPLDRAGAAGLDRLGHQFPADAGALVVGVDRGV